MTKPDCVLLAVTMLWCHLWPLWPFHAYLRHLVFVMTSLCLIHDCHGPYRFVVMHEYMMTSLWSSLITFHGLFPCYYVIYGFYGLFMLYLRLLLFAMTWLCLIYDCHRPYRFVVMHEYMMTSLWSSLITFHGLFPCYYVIYGFYGLFMLYLRLLVFAMTWLCLIYDCHRPYRLAVIHIYMRMSLWLSLITFHGL